MHRFSRLISKFHNEIQPVKNILSHESHVRCLSAAANVPKTSNYDFQVKDLAITKSSSLKPKPKDDDLVFGHSMSDHMLVLEWNHETGWSKPSIEPYKDFLLDPTSSVFHYGSQIYEGLKAYRGEDGQIRLFRPMENINRFWKSAERMALPTFDKDELYKCMVELVKVDQDWVPHSQSCSLYIRPSLIGTEKSLGVKVPKSALLFLITCPVGPYFKSGTFNPVSLLADPKYIRSWPGGVGEVKAGGNYGATVFIQKEAGKIGCDQVLWLFNDEVTEVGTMNLFMYWTNENGGSLAAEGTSVCSETMYFLSVTEQELITPPLNGLTLHGITRKSILELAKGWDDFKVTEKTFTMKQVAKAAREGRVKEMFGSGTACMVCPVNRILYENEASLAYTFLIFSQPNSMARSLTKKVLHPKLPIISNLINNTIGHTPRRFGHERFHPGGKFLSNILHENEGYSKNIHIPTMENGPDLTKRIHKELNDIQYGRIDHHWSDVIC
eukprot:gene18104-19913_t